MSNEHHGKRDLDVKPRLLYTHLSTGDAQYHDVEKMALVEFDITNNSDETIDVNLVSEIEEYSFKLHYPLSLAPGEHRVCRQLPRIKDTSVKQLNRNTPTQVLTSYINEEITHSIKQDLPLTLMPYNTIIWTMPHPSKARDRIYLFHHIVAWIYDDDDDDVKEVQETVLEQLEHEGKQLGYPLFLKDYSDEQTNPRALVKTIFSTLRNVKQLTYRDDSEIIPLSAKEIGQRVRRPGDTLRGGKGNCIDIAVLCANLIKTVKLDPVIVIKANHAFVGWKSYSSRIWNSLSADEQRERQQYEFLDTSWTKELNTTFEEACTRGIDLYEEILAKKWLNKRPFSRHGFARILDIKAYYKSLEQKKTQATFFKVLPIEAPSLEAPPQDNNQSAALPEHIIRPAIPEIDSNTAQQRYLRAVSDYITGLEKTLARIQSLENSSDLTENDCNYTLDILNLIGPADLPKVENISSEDRQLGYRLDALLDSADRLKTSIDSLRMRHKEADASQGKSPRRSFSSPIISWQYRELLKSTKEIARDVDVAVMPGNRGTQNDAATMEQCEETENNDKAPPNGTSGDIEVFYSYVAEDEQLAERLRKHLSLLKREELITDWHAGKVVPNQEPSEEIRKHLNSARIILLLISPDYLFSDYHNTVEVKRAMERSGAGEAIVMPILLYATDDLSHAPFGKLQIFPRNHKPINEWEDKDKALAEITREIRAVVSDIQP